MGGARPLTEGQYSRMIKACSGEFGKRDKLMVQLGCHTGLRIAELLWVRWCDLWPVGRNEPELYVPSRALKGGGAGRVIRLSPRLEGPVREWYRETERLWPGEEKGHVFVTRVRTVMSARMAQKVIVRLAKEAGVPPPYGTHMLRKTYAARMYKALGGDLHLLRDALGHASITSTVLYLESNEDRILEAQGALEIGDVEG